MKKLAAIAALGVALSSPALATEWISCAAPGGEASFDFLVSSLDILAIAGLNVSVGDKVWASDVAYGPGDPVEVGQAFEDTQTIRIDAMDEAISQKIAELRLFKASEGDVFVYAGTLRIPGYGAWAVSCEGP
ncbi:MAG: hypothetical protein ABIO40_07945 [Devosia sp.]